MWEHKFSNTGPAEQSYPIAEYYPGSWKCLQGCQIVPPVPPMQPVPPMPPVKVKYKGS